MREKIIDTDCAWMLLARPPRRVPLSQWAEENITLTPRTGTNFPGPYRCRLTPYLRGPMDALDDPRIHTVVIVKGAQTGATQLGYIWMANRAMLDPGPMLVIYPSDDLARSASSVRCMPLFEDSAALTTLLPDNRKEQWTKLQYMLKSCVINWTGSNSPANLASRPIRYVFGDEVSKWPGQSGDESDPVNLVLQRQKTFEHNRKALFASTPTIGDDAIMRLAQRGDGRKLHVPCPYCRAWQIIKWPNVKFDSKASIDIAAYEAFYECEACHHAWTQSDRNDAIAGGEWRATQTPQDPGVASFHIPSFLAPWVKWGPLVRKFLRSKSNPVELQDFINSELGEPFVQADLSIHAGALAERELACCEAGKRFNERPEMASRYEGKQAEAIVGVDVQQTFLRVVVRQFVEGGDSCLLWKGAVTTFAELDAKATEFGATACLVDARYRFEDVYSAMQVYSGIWPIIGIDTKHMPVMFERRTYYPDEGKKGSGQGRTVEVMNANSQALLTMLAERADGFRGAPAWHLYNGATQDKEYVREMTANMRVNGLWVNPQKKANHYADAEKLCLLGAYVRGYRRDEQSKPSEKITEDEQEIANLTTAGSNWNASVEKAETV